MKKEEKDLKTVPLYGFHTTYESREANKLIASQEWICERVTDRGKYIMKRIR